MLAPGLKWSRALIDETQVAEIQLAVKALAAMLQAHGQINGHQRVYAEL